MSLLAELQRRSRQIVLPIIGAATLFYFGYHSIQGDKGLLSYLRLKQEVRKAEISLSEIRGQRETLENRVRLLQPGSLDLDMLEEQARRVLNLAHPDDLVVPLPPR